VLGTVGAAVKGAVVLDPVADHLTAAVRAGGCQRVDGTLEGVKRLRPSGHRHGERLVVVVPAHVTLCPRGTLATEFGIPSVGCREAHDTAISSARIGSPLTSMTACWASCFA